MIPDQFYYQRMVLGLLWLCVMLHFAWPSRGVTTQTKPSTPIIPRRKRSNAPKPVAGLTPKPSCALCAQEAVHPHAPLVPPDPRRRLVRVRHRVVFGTLEAVQQGFCRKVAFSRVWESVTH